MAYSNNPLLPKARRWAVNLVIKDGLSVALAAAKAGVHRSTLYRWLVKAKQLHGLSGIPTNSSRPHFHPRQLPEWVVERIKQLRRDLKRGGGYIHAVLLGLGIRVSLASVNRVLTRVGYLDGWYQPKGKLKRARIPRPKVEHPGDLVEVDTIHFRDYRTKRKSYVYTLIDLKTRWVHAMASEVLSPKVSAMFVMEAQKFFPYHFSTIQTDNGLEFANEFEKELNQNGINQRRIRLGKKNDNAHIERFNRTIQDEALGRWPKPEQTQGLIDDYIEFYNNHRLHSSLQYRTPDQVLQRF
jgi:transposase InsO family protein